MEVYAKLLGGRVPINCQGMWAASRSWKRTSSAILNRSSKSGHPLIVPDLKWS